MRDPTAVWYEDKLYVGGHTEKTYEDDARLYVYTPTTDTWDIDTYCTPVWSFSLTTYRSRLMLVGGREYDDSSKGSITNEIWTLSEDGRLWEPDTVPPMETKRHSVCAVSYEDNLLVAGGWTSKGSSNVVEIYNGRHWSYAQSLPIGYDCLKSAILDQHWYLMGGEGDSDLLAQNNAVHYASIDSLLATSELSEQSAVWKRLTDTPYQYSSTAVFGGRLVTIGGEGALDLSCTSSIYAYSLHATSWIHVGDMQFAASNTCVVVLPTGELMVVGGSNDRHFTSTVQKASIKGMVIKFCDNIVVVVISSLTCSYSI